MPIDDLVREADIPQLVAKKGISRLMSIIWWSRDDLRHAFDLTTPDGQAGFIEWYEKRALAEYGLPPVAPLRGRPPRQPDASFYRLKARLTAGGKSTRWIPSSIRRKLFGLAARIFASKAEDLEQEAESRFEQAEAGANLIGYAHGVLGMGEHVRMTARALGATDIKAGVVNFSVGVMNREQPQTDELPLITTNRFKTNIFHVNADQMLVAYGNLGPDFFRGRYNIGYWAWELERCPDNWIPVIDMVDEIWAPSRFIQDCFAKVTEKPVTFMPLCVELPAFARRSRAHFRLPEKDFLFLFMFDFMSYIDRKNPAAAIHAFLSAFPDRTDRAGLVIKAMNVDPAHPRWTELVELMHLDPRIHLINDVMSRQDVLALVDSCNSFLSLHRSEGFGRGPAEAMYLGKPVIVTNYSGNTDFTTSENSLLVDYDLIDILPGQYAFPDNQRWADPHVEHAAAHMRRLFDFPDLAHTIGLKGQSYIKEYFSAEATGKIMRDRLRHLNLG